MSAATRTAPRSGVSAKTLGVLAVIGLVAAFSLSSTLVKRAESPGVLVTLTSAIAAQGLLVYAQRTIQIGTIGIAQQAQPALAMVWSFLLLDEVINGRQAAGIAIVIAGLVAFVVVHQRGGRPGRAP